MVLDNTRNRVKKTIITERGFLGSIIVAIIDKIFYVIKLIIHYIWNYVILATYGYIYDVMLSGFDGVFGGKEKNGECFNSIYLKYVVTIFAPPVGILMSRGISAWVSIILSVLLTFYHVIPGIIYALVITNDSRYADRYQRREMERIEATRQKQSPSNFYVILVSMVILIAMVYGFIRFAQHITNLKH